MKTKTINKTIKSKMDEWIETLPAGLRAEAKDNVIVTGGCIASMFLGEPVNDFDVYFKSKEPLEKIVQSYIEGMSDVELIEDDSSDRLRIFVKSLGARKFEAPPEGVKYAVSYITENALTLTDSIQLITRFVGTPEEIHKNYDFIHATNYWTYKDGLVLNTGALSSLLTKELVYAGSKYPLCSIIRTRKFIKRGFTVNAGQYLKMALQLNELDLKDIEVLHDQLVGVDSAYFEVFIQCLKHKIDEEGMTAITSTYLFNLVDMIFERSEGISEEE